MTQTTQYAIQFYGPDGSTGSLGMIEDGFTSLDSARRAARSRIGGNFGHWCGERDNDPAGWETVEAWHESAEEGCGGYGILRSA